MSEQAPQRHVVDPFVLASDFLTSSPPAHAITRLNCFRRMRTSLRPIEFPVYASCGSFDGMSILPNHATLGTGGWLNLTRWRLSLYKKRQTCLAHWILIIGHSMLLLRPRSWRPHPAEACRATACRELPSGPRGLSRAGPRVPISGCRRPHVVCL